MTENAVDIETPEDGDNEVKKFCAAVGELILWANLIDTQLNKAMLGTFALPEHPVIEPIVAQLDARQKSELLKKRAKLIKALDWRTKILKWVERAEKVNGKRNVVAHHGMRIENGEIILYSDQLGKIIDSLDKVGGNLAPGRSMGLADVLKWIDYAKGTYEEGRIVLTNLIRFRETALAALNAARN